jgi:hypothetical protein
MENTELIPKNQVYLANRGVITCFRITLGGDLRVDADQRLTKFAVQKGKSTFCRDRQLVKSASTRQFFPFLELISFCVRLLKFR